MKSKRKPGGKYLFIEGTSNEENGKLAQGFHKLLLQKLKGKMPRIKMANGKSEAVQTFKKSKLSPDKYLLVDLDAPEENRTEDIRKNDLETENSRCFYMIQEMEAWFLSQPGILDTYFKSKISIKIKRPAKEIPNPDEFLQSITKSTPKGTYHKVEDGTALLQMLDANQLMQTFNDFSALVKRLGD